MTREDEALRDRERPARRRRRSAPGSPGARRPIADSRASSRAGDGSGRLSSCRRRRRPPPGFAAPRRGAGARRGGRPSRCAPLGRPALASATARCRRRGGGDGGRGRRRSLPEIAVDGARPGPRNPASLADDYLAARRSCWTADGGAVSAGLAGGRAAARRSAVNFGLAGGGRHWRSRARRPIARDSDRGADPGGRLADRLGLEGGVRGAFLAVQRRLAETVVASPARDRPTASASCGASSLAESPDRARVDALLAELGERESDGRPRLRRERPRRRASCLDGARASATTCASSSGSRRRAARATARSGRRSCAVASAANRARRRRATEARRLRGFATQRVIISARDPRPRLRGNGGMLCGGEELLDAPVTAGRRAWIDIEGSEKEHEQRCSAGAPSTRDRGHLHPLPPAEGRGVRRHDLRHRARHRLQRRARPALRRHLETLKLAAFLCRRPADHRAPRAAAERRRRCASGSRRAAGRCRAARRRSSGSICDEMMDLYFPIVDEIGAEIEKVEALVVESPEPRAARARAGDAAPARRRCGAPCCRTARSSPTSPTRAAA